MKKYKPSVLGKLFPVGDEKKAMDFMHNKFDKFNELYNSISEDLPKINDITPIEDKGGSGSFKVFIETDSDTMQSIATKKGTVTGNTLII